jgi:hypothetical protein
MKQSIQSQQFMILGKPEAAGHFVAPNSGEKEWPMLVDIFSLGVVKDAV